MNEDDQKFYEWLKKNHSIKVTKEEFERIKFDFLELPKIFRRQGVTNSLWILNKHCPKDGSMMMNYGIFRRENISYINCPTCPVCGYCEVEEALKKA